MQSCKITICYGKLPSCQVVKEAHFSIKKVNCHEADRILPSYIPNMLMLFVVFASACIAIVN